MTARKRSRVYGDSHTLDRPTDEEAAVMFHDTVKSKTPHPLDRRDVVEEADQQAWGS